MKKFWIVVAIIVVAAAAYYFAAGRGMQTSDKTDNGAMMKDDTVDPALLTASFRCDNDSSFVATFTPDMKSVTIASEGEDNTFAMMASPSGKKYGNDSWTFFFQGENATVTDVKAGKSSTCTPPVVPGMAPMNFGN